MGRRLTIRPATEADLPAILDLLEPQEFVKPLTRSLLQACFLYRWRRPDHDLGFVISDPEGQIGGVLQVIYSPLRGAGFATATLSMLFVKPGFQFERDREARKVRRLALEMTRAAMSLPFLSLSLSAHGPNDVVAQTLDQELGWERFSEAEIFTPLRPMWPLRLPAIDLAALTPEQRQIVADHAPYGCRATVVDRCLLVTRRTNRYKAGTLWPRLPRGRSRHVPVTEVLHMSAPDRAVATWRPLVAAICRRDWSVGVVSTESFFETAHPPGQRIPVTLRVYNRGMVPKHAIDKLYTEAVLLP